MSTHSSSHYVDGPFGDFGEIETGIAMTVDVAIEIRLQLW